MNPIHNSLGRLRQRVNVTTRHPLDGDQLVILYDDHRWLLNVMFKIQKEKLLPEPPKLIFFDSHDDCAGTRPKSDLLSSLDVENLLDARGNTGTGSCFIKDCKYKSNNCTNKA